MSHWTTSRGGALRDEPLVPFVVAAFLGEQLARRLIVQSYAAVRTEGGSAGLYINLKLMALLALGLLLSLVPLRRESS